MSFRSRFSIVSPAPTHHEISRYCTSELPRLELGNAARSAAAYCCSGLLVLLLLLIDADAVITDLRPGMITRAPHQGIVSRSGQAGARAAPAMPARWLAWQFGAFAWRASRLLLLPTPCCCLLPPPPRACRLSVWRLSTRAAESSRRVESSQSSRVFLTLTRARAICILLHSSAQKPRGSHSSTSPFELQVAEPCCSPEEPPSPAVRLPYGSGRRSHPPSWRAVGRAAFGRRPRSADRHRDQGQGTRLLVARHRGSFSAVAFTLAAGPAGGLALTEGQRPNHRRSSNLTDVVSDIKATLAGLFGGRHLTRRRRRPRAMTGNGATVVTATTTTETRRMRKVVSPALAARSASLSTMTLSRTYP